MAGPQLGRIGVWSGELRFNDPGEVAEAAAELEELGYGTLWLPGVTGGDIFERIRTVLAATKSIVAATGIVNVWAHTPEETAAAHAELTRDYPGRFMLGLGVSHQQLVDTMNLGTYGKPVATMRAYLDALDAAHPPVPASERCLAALRPRMRGLAAERTAGTHSYLVTPEHTQAARESMGPGALIAPEQTVVPIADPDAARALGRVFLGLYLGLSNYMDNLKEYGFTDADMADGGSDRLIDAIVAWGTPEQIRARLDEQFDAGADHVCIQVVTPGFEMEKVLRGEVMPLPREAWRELAPALID